MNTTELDRIKQLLEWGGDKVSEKDRVERLLMYYVSNINMRLDLIKEVAENKGIDISWMESILADIWNDAQELQAAVKYDRK